MYVEEDCCIWHLSQGRNRFVEYELGISNKEADLKYALRACQLDPAGLWMPWDVREPGNNGLPRRSKTIEGVAID
jgi:hypothetical protein